MYQRKSRLQNIIILLFDCVCIVLSLILANYVRNGRAFRSDNERMNFGILLGNCLTIYFAINIFKNVGRDLFGGGLLWELRCIVQNNVFMIAGAAVVLYYFHLLDAYSRLVFLLFFLLDCGLMFLIHQLWKNMFPLFLKQFKEARKVLVVTEKEHADELIQNLKNMDDFSYELTGIALVDENSNADTFQDFDGIEVVADKSNLIDRCKSAPLDEVIIAVSDKRKKEILPEMEILAEMGITIHYQIPIPELNSAKQKEFSQFGSSYMVTYANQMVSVGQILLKRLLDLCGGTIGCLFLLFLTIVMGPLIKMESRGPVFFVQKRVGRNGRIFKMYKFRSMYEDAEMRKEELMALNEMDGLMFKIEKDPRITKIGSFLRKTSLDEFPQFINILKGDMSMVGTRPPTLDEFAQYSPYHKKRLSFRPGLTGMWQVNGRSNITDFEEIVKLDVAYIDNWSLRLDLKILIKTLMAVFIGSGAK